MSVREGMGGLYEISLPMGGGSATATQLTYGTMNSNFWGAGVLLHYLVPAVVLLVAGVLLAVTVAGIGDALGAKVAASQQEPVTADSTTASGAPQQVE